VDTSLYEYFQKQVANTGTDSRYICIYTCLQPPLDVAFNIQSFGAERESVDEEARRRWADAGGIDTFLSFELVGYASHPDAFAERKVEVAVNPLFSLPRFDLVPRGLIGDGVYDGSRFRLRLYLAHDVTDAFLAHVLARGRRTEPSEPLPELFRRWSENRAEWQGEEHRLDLLEKFQNVITGHDPALANICFGICDVRSGDRLAQGKTLYNICGLSA
jgi:hypothetical protein